MTPRQFTTFRDRLDAASGFQSAQFRELEAILGRRDAARVDRYPPESPSARSGSPTRWRARACSTPSCATWRRRASACRARRSSATSPSRRPRRRRCRTCSSTSTATTAREAQVCERLVDLDEGLQEWRYRHVKMVERTIGDKAGHGRLVGRRVPAHDALRRRCSPTCGRVRRPPVSPTAAPHYSRFRVAERLLLTGHSHQAWPDVALEGQVEAFDDAARARRREVGARVRQGRRGARRLPRGCSATPTARSRWARTPTSSSSACSRRSTCASARASSPPTASSTRCAASSRGWTRQGSRSSACPRSRRTRWPSAWPPPSTSAPAPCSSPPCSSRPAHIVPGLGALARACARAGAELVVDAYHALGARPVRPPRAGARRRRGWSAAATSTCSSARATASCACPRTPRTCAPRSPGWYAEFGALADEHDPSRVAYGRGAERFAGVDLRPDEPLPRRRACSPSSTSRA